MPTYTQNKLHTIPAGLDFLPLDSLRHGKNFYVTGQSGLFHADERAWAYDEGGYWVGPGPFHGVPVNLSLESSTPETWPKTGVDIIHRVASGAELILTWGSALNTTDQARYRSDDFNWEYRIQDLSTGDIVNSGHINGQHLTLSTLPDGSYLAMVHVNSAKGELLLPPDYVKDNDFQWGDASSEYWDYIYNVGKLPPAGHSFYALRADLVKKNQQKDKTEWTQYLTSTESQGGEWSGRLFQIGDGEFTVSENPAIPASGASLFKIEDVTNRTPVFVDPMMRTGNVLKARMTGTLLLAGQRMTETGIVTALWELEDDWTLLGTNLNPSTMVCECALENHGPTDIHEKADGTLFILTKCSLHRFDPEAEGVENRLPGYPTEAESHFQSPLLGKVEHGFPGGSSLRELDEVLYHTTENFEDTSYKNIEGEKRSQFYDTLQITRGQTRSTGPGTRFHGNNDMAFWLGKLWTVIQDKPDDDPTAKQYITYFAGTDWALDSRLVFDPAKVQLQRLIGTPGCGANTLMLFGKKSDSEQGIIGMADGVNLTQDNFNYRIRRATLSPNAVSDSKVLLVIGRESTAEAINEDAWHIIEITIDGDETGSQPEITQPDPETCEGGVAAMVVRVTPQDGKPIYAVECTSVEPDRRIENFNIDNAGIWARIDSPDSAADASTFNIQLPYGRRFILPIPANEYVDVLFFVPYGCEGLDVGPKVLVRN